MKQNKNIYLIYFKQTSYLHLHYKDMVYPAFHKIKTTDYDFARYLFVYLLFYYKYITQILNDNLYIAHLCVFWQFY